MGCKLDCHYCPQRILLNKYFACDKNRCSDMSFSDFKAVLNKVKRGGTICFSGMCEPFHNQRCADMIAYAYNEGFKVSLLTTLIGMKKDDIFKLRDVNFDNITLHIPDQEGNSKFNITNEYMEILDLFHKTFNISDYSCHGTIHSDIIDHINKDLILSSKMMDRAGNLDCGMSSNPKGEIVCMASNIIGGSYGNWTPEILPDGTVLLCCMDYGMKHILGNILTISVNDILSSKEYCFVKKGMKYEKLDVLCRKCNYAIQKNNTPAYKFLKKLDNYKKGNYEGLTKEQTEILRLFLQSNNICVFGMGKLFWNNFFNHLWSDVLGHKYYCDNNSKMWGQMFFGIKCVSPTELSKLSDVLVVTFISDDLNVRKQFKNMGVNNILNINKLYSLFC